MKKNKFIAILLCLVTLSFAAVSCGGDDDDDDTVSSDVENLAGTWRCTEADIEDFSMTYEGFELPGDVLGTVMDQIEASLVGSETVIDPAKVKLTGKVLLFTDSGIEWRINSMTRNTLDVTYKTTTTEAGATIDMTLDCKFKRVR